MGLCCAAGGTADQGLFASVHNNCIINPSLSGLSERLSLAKVVPLAVDRAISEIIFPTVERSVTIGRMTTLELVNKVCMTTPGLLHLQCWSCSQGRLQLNRLSATAMPA